MVDQPSVAIIGAGMSGLAAAHTYRDAGYIVTLFEQSAMAGGRASTRTQSGFSYDHGAQYVKQVHPDTISFITQRFQTPDLLTIPKPIWIFDRAGSIQEGDPQQNAEPRWSYRYGLSSLAQTLSASLTIQYTTSVTYVQQQGHQWLLSLRKNGHPDTISSAGPYDLLLITLPLPQAHTLLEQSQLDAELKHTILTRLAQSHYHPLLSVALGYQPCPQTRPYYALVNTDKGHTISWLAWEHEKAPERAPANAGLLIAQMSPSFSQRHWETPDNALVNTVAQQVSTLLNEPLTTPCFSAITRWPNALPTQPLTTDLNELTIPHALAFCGDGFVGGRIQLAIEHGIIISYQTISHKS
jgi:renalase